MHAAQGDRTAERRRPRPARDAADVALARVNCRPGSRHTLAVEPQAYELPGDASMSAMHHADDHFLSDVAPLRKADRTRLDARLERNRLFVHVAMKQRHAGFDANG